jgi:hypothetical protein
MATIISSRSVYLLTVTFDGTEGQREKGTEDGKLEGKRMGKTKDASFVSKLASGGGGVYGFQL